jgi:hypothetical protein
MVPGSPAGTEDKDLLKPPDLGQFTYAGAGEGVVGRDQVR